MKADNILMMGQHHGPWTHVQKRGRQRFGNGGFTGVKEGGNKESRFDVLENLNEDLDIDGNPVINSLDKNT